MPKLSISHDGPAGSEVKHFASMRDVVAYVREQYAEDCHHPLGLQLESGLHEFHGFDWYDVRQFEADELASGVHDRWVEREGGGWALYRKDEYIGQALGSVGYWSAYIYDESVKDPDYDPNFRIGRGYPDADTAKRAVQRWVRASEAGTNSIFAARWQRNRLGEIER